MNNSSYDQDQINSELAKGNFREAAAFINEIPESTNKIHSEHKKDLIAFHDKIAFYSAGVISLSITFVGSIISVDKKILGSYIYIPISILNMLLEVPIRYFFFGAWGALTISLLMSIFIRLNISLHTLYSKGRDWVKDLKEHQQTIIKLSKTNPNHDIDDLKRLENTIEGQESDILLEKLHNKKIIYEDSTQLLQISSIFAFIFGITLLLITVIISINYTIKT